MHRMASPVRNHISQNLLPQKSEIANQVQYLVTHELVSKAQWRILHTIFSKHNAVVPRRASDQAHIAQCLLILA